MVVDQTGPSVLSRLLRVLVPASNSLIFELLEKDHL